MKIIKKIGWFGSFVTIVLTLVILWLLKPFFLSFYLTNRLGVKVTVESIGVGSRGMKIGNFKIKNPHGYKRRHAFKAEKIKVEYRIKSLFGNPSEIDRIALENVFLSVEFDEGLGSKNNWTEILTKMPKSSHEEKERILHHLTLDNLKVQIRGVGEVQTRKVDHIELTEISSKEGFPTRELIEKIFGGIGLEQYLQHLINPANTLHKLLNPFGETPKSVDSL